MGESPTKTAARTPRWGTYNNGQPYIPARGRYAPREAVEDYYRSISHAVVDLDGERPTRDEFLRKINREWKILSAKTSAHTPAQPAPVQNTPPPVGRLEIHMRAAPDCGPGERRAQVTLGIQHPSGPVYLKGIVVREMRPGWLNVQVPPMESWTDPMRRLTHDQRERLETPEFYELLQREISRRFTPELFQSG